ncbi:MAG TPA: serine/threonine-protein kinase [Polyangiaceae bacterium]|nr:serine/threonine-protein kinase [Polyangiaceae bacterium]
MSDEVPALAVGTLIAGKLRIVRALGIGGMGTVYEVEHELTRHRRALKLLHPEFASNSQAVARFLREASAAGRIGSEHIVETFDAGSLETGEPYLVMEMLDGRSLADLLEEHGRVPEANAIDWVAQACDGLQAAHDAGIIHRDIKPDNLFIQRSGRVKILDFGISKFDPGLTGEKQLTGDLTLGTPYYMAPEQTSNTSSVDQRADVYALGVVLYECVTGRKPFEAETYPQLIVRIHLGDYAPASSIAPSAALLDGVIARAMARKPEERFQTPAELASALRELARATERHQSPYETTKRAENLESLLERHRRPELAPTQPRPASAPPAAPAANAVTPQSPPRASTPPSGNDATLVSAGSQPPPAAVAARASRRVAIGLALAAAAAAAALWWTRSEPSVAAPATDARRASAEPARSSTSAEPLTTTTASALEPPPVAVASTSAAPPAPAAVPGSPALAKSAKPGTRAHAHDLEEENPFK